MEALAQGEDECTTSTIFLKHVRACIACNVEHRPLYLNGALIPSVFALQCHNQTIYVRNPGSFVQLQP